MKPRNLQSTPRPSRRRQGLTALVLVLGVIGTLVVVSLAGRVQTDQTRRLVHRAQLSGMARLEAETANQRRLAQLRLAVNDPESEVFRRIRETMNDGFATLELTDALPLPDPSIRARGTHASGAEYNLGSGRVVSSTVTLHGTRSSRDLGGSEEWVGVVTFDTLAEFEDRNGHSSRRVIEAHELRTAMTLVPRPFDQMGLYLGRIDQRVDFARANALREQWLDGQEELRRAIADESATSNADLKKRLETLALSIQSDEVVRARTPVLPEGEGALWGFYANPLDLTSLDLDDPMSRHDACIRRERATIRALKSRGLQAVESLEALTAAYSDALNTLWRYQRVFTVAGRDSAGFTAGVGRFEARLCPEFFLDRVSTRVEDGDAYLAEWGAGRARLEGVVDATGLSDRLELSGDLAGRTMLLVGEAGARLTDLNIESQTREDHLTLVSLGGPVTVVGEVRASVIVLPTPTSAGRVTVTPTGTLIGSLIVPDPMRTVASLEGQMRLDADRMAAFPPEATLDRPGRGEYVVTVSSRPIFRKEAAR